MGGYGVLSAGAHGCAAAQSPPRVCGAWAHSPRGCDGPLCPWYTVMSAVAGLAAAAAGCMFSAPRRGRPAYPGAVWAGLNGTPGAQRLPCHGHPPRERGRAPHGVGRGAQPPFLVRAAAREGLPEGVLSCRSARAGECVGACFRCHWRPGARVTPHSALCAIVRGAWDGTAACIAGLAHVGLPRGRLGHHFGVVQWGAAPPCVGGSPKGHSPLRARVGGQARVPHRHNAWRSPGGYWGLRRHAYSGCLAR